MFRRYARRPARRPTPATLMGVSGRPTRALAVSTETDKVFACDHWRDRGTAQRSAAPRAAAVRLHIFMTLSSFFSPGAPKSFAAEAVSAFAPERNAGDRRFSAGHTSHPRCAVRSDRGRNNPPSRSVPINRQAGRGPCNVILELLENAAAAENAVVAARHCATTKR